MPRPSISVLLPCLNEATSIARVLAELQALARCNGQWRWQIVVIDNGSTDASVSIAQASRARVLLCRARGYGRAVRMGIDAVRSDFVVCIDADDAHDISQIPVLVHRLIGGADLVVGSRQRARQPLDRVSALHHYVGTPFLTWLANQRHAQSNGPRLSDITSGLYAIRKKKLDELRLTADGFDLNVQIFVAALRQGWRVAEVPVIQRRPIPGRLSHLRTVADGWLVLQRILGDFHAL